MCVYFRTKFQISSTILTSFKQGGGGHKFTPGTRPPPPPQNEPQKSPPRLGLSTV